ncbi:MAG: UrcA family protein [Sphingomonadaceae bacterium]
MKIIIIATALALSTLSPTAGQAADPVQVSTTVKSSDLNLSTDHGVRTLKLRVSRAATELCGGDTNNNYSEAYKAYKKCYKSAVQPAFAAIESKASVLLTSR